MPYIHIKGKTKIPQGTMEDFNRPNHPDFLVSSELAKAKFSGLRHNSITNETEIWVLGHMRKSIPHGDTELLNEAYQEVFGMSLELVSKEVK